MTKHPNPDRLCRRTLAALAAACALATAQAAGSGAAAPAATAAAVDFRLLHTLPLPSQPVDGLQMQELSGLAYDADEQLLYAVSDRGTLFHLRIVINGERIEQLLPLRAYTLHDPHDPARKFNAEGLAAIDAANGVRGDTRLAVALENGPALVRITPQGELLGEVELPPALRDRARFQSKNKRLESVALHPRHGLVTAPEAPLAGEPESRHTLYATDGATWSFDALQPGSDLKGIETLPDGQLLVLERFGGSRDRAAVLRRIDPAACGGARACRGGDAPAAQASVAAGNFEGMTRLADGRLLLVSDATARQGAATFALVELQAP